MCASIFCSFFHTPLAGTPSGASTSNSALLSSDAEKNVNCDRRQLFIKDSMTDGKIESIPRKWLEDEKGGGGVCEKNA